MTFVFFFLVNFHHFANFPHHSLQYVLPPFHACLAGVHLHFFVPPPALVFRFIYPSRSCLARGNSPFPLACPLEFVLSGVWPLYVGTTFYTPSSSCGCRIRLVHGFVWTCSPFVSFCPHFENTDWRSKIVIFHMMV